VQKTEILWHLLDTTYSAYVEPGWRVGATPIHGVAPGVARGGSGALR